MMRSLYSAVSGIKTHQTKMDVIGNNVANVNTVAFKSSSVTFSEIMYQTVSGASGANAATGGGGVNAKQIGLGVNTAATKVSISTAGASETTGNPFDIKLTDNNSTNFFVVSNGSQNLFTRAGSFYIDGVGNLAMSSTGYSVMGWQVDPTTGEIKKDSVSALRILQEKNLTSNAEATTNGSVAGVLDKNDSNINSEDGYIMNLNFYDNLGYSYTAKFSVKAKDSADGLYTVELSDILNGEGNSILTNYLSTAGNSLSDIFGVDTTKESTYSLDSASGVKYNNTGSDITYTSAASGTTVTIAAGEYYTTYTDYTAAGVETLGYAPVTIDPTAGTYSIPSYTYYASAADAASSTTTASTDVSGAALEELFGVSATQIGYLNNTANPTAALVDGNLVITEDAVNYELKYDPSTGSFSYISDVGAKSVSMNLADTLGGNFSNIDVDFSQTINSNNSGSATLSIDAGATDGVTGAGKALGALTGISISTNGKIYGSYDNGNTQLLGQIAVAQFSNASGLEKVGENCYKTTLNSGDFDGVGVEISSDGSSMATGVLEMSNVDLASEFTQMIITQRGYQANSRVITTSDTLLEELINLKR
ncbi:MAG: flagellar hook-basal body complex protein [Lachnospiraceae bacterium]